MRHIIYFIAGFVSILLAGCLGIVGLVLWITVVPVAAILLAIYEVGKKTVGSV